MRNDNAVIRVQPLGGQWQQIGTGNWAGYWPEGIQASSNARGFDAMSFTLHRDPGAGGAADLRAFTPIEFEVAGVVVWEGYIWETPTQDSPTDMSINVACRGWQYSLDDEQYRKGYVQSDMSIWRDARTYPTTPLGNFVQGLFVRSEDNGSMAFGMQSGGTWPTTTAAGVMADFGPDPNMWPKFINVELARGPGGTTASTQFYARGADDPSSLFGTTHDAFTINTNTLSQPPTWSTNSGTFSVVHRYVCLFIWNNGATYSAGADDNVLIRAVRCYYATTYESGGASVLTADVVIKDVLTNAAPELDQSTVDITPTTFAIPDFTVPEHKTSREILDAANAFHNYKLKVGRNKRLIFKPQPSDPELETMERPGSEFNDTSANVAEELFNRVIVTGQGPDGANIAVLRTATQSSLATRLIAPPGVGVSNPSFMTNLSGWTTAVNSGTGTITWDSNNAFTGVAGSGCMMFTGTTAGGGAYATMTGTFKKGQTYVIRFWMSSVPTVAAAGTVFPQIFNTYPTPTKIFHENNGAWKLYNISWNQYRNTLHTDGNWEQFELRWVPDANYTNPVFFMDAITFGAGTGKRFDELSVYTSQQTLLDRWDRNRTATLAINSPITTVVAQQLGDVFLALRAKTPFKGQWKLTGEKAAWGASDKHPVHPSTLLINGGDLVRFAHLIDPDTGAVGRDGLLANVQYSHDDRVVLGDVDNTRSDFEALLGRLATVTQNRIRY